MGFLWDLVQQNQLTRQRMADASLDDRVAALEDELKETRELQQTLIARLEKHFSEDIDGDGQVG